MSMEAHLTDYQLGKMGLALAEAQGLCMHAAPNACVIPQFLTTLYALVRSPPSLADQDAHAQRYVHFNIGRDHTQLRADGSEDSLQQPRVDPETGKPLEIPTYEKEKLWGQCVW